jgi:hypothetical protein
MATIDICDICESREKVSTQHYVIGSCIDLGGGQSEDDFESFDLCQECELKILRNYVYKGAQNRAERIVYGIPLIEIIKRLQDLAKKKI